MLDYARPINIGMSMHAAITPAVAWSEHMHSVA
jgi:hypothetical protein